MQLTFMVCMVTMMLFFTFILLRRVRLELTRAEYERLRLDLLALAERHGAHAQRRIVAGAEPAEPTTVETPRLS
jgi:hypothetical protein